MKAPATLDEFYRTFPTSRCTERPGDLSAGSCRRGLIGSSDPKHPVEPGANADR